LFEKVPQEKRSSFLSEFMEKLSKYAEAYEGIVSNPAKIKGDKREDIELRQLINDFR
jgi:hypothetical protein